MTSTFRILLGATLAASFAASASANLIVNGDFETGTHAGWTTNVQAGSNGNLFVAPNNGGNAPLSNLPYQLNAAGGEFFSITDQNGGGAYSLTQSFTLAASTTVTISFDHFANNQSGTNINNGRKYDEGANQNATVDLLMGGADPFTTAAGDILAVFFGPGSDNLAGNPNPWTSYSFNVQLAAGTYTLRFAEADNQFFFQQGVDNVSVVDAVPEPATWALMIIGFGLAGAAIRRANVSAVSFA